MLSLEIELIAILVLAAVVGILMGRFLCKNGENEEREKKDKIIHAYKALKNEFETTQSKIKKQDFMLKALEEGVAQGEQEIENSQTKLNSSDKQRTQLLDELKVLEKYKSRFDSLDREFKLQSKIVDGLKNEKIANQKEISDFKIMTNGLTKNIVDFKRGQGELESDMDKLNKTLKERMLSKETEHDTMLQKTHKKYQTQLEGKVSTYEKFEEESNKRYKETVQLKDKAYEELKISLESVENEYEEFKINHGLDSDRLDELELDHQKIYHTLETVISERDDLVARIRAISSVVGAVGIDSVSGDKNQQLLENR